MVKKNEKRNENGDLIYYKTWNGEGRMQYYRDYGIMHLRHSNGEDLYFKGEKKDGEIIRQKIGEKEFREIEHRFKEQEFLEREEQNRFDLLEFE